mmetsp:Transcript_37516/g.58584  ORF Transcript_37516/g.58584 Transcript_37516/m.58584 type:complete len:223 (-) Transcript_37516:96-764(-)|eukprot:CAMPEP_0194692186 /NCGR_PEP_ID=MMETSP0295-20121207/19573_1 /TAXON_ID=39354 /ORGANISM="Heterosigma akashiwo, Strain CCMP2393" /LENGTH=222 /DNA_ID=CAMNT_0039582403 /DNA_START=20 /DNA_END=688 /DNA_ORIENTATION=-
MELSFKALALILAALAVRVRCQTPFDMNGGSVLAMAGKNCVAVAVDKRFGVGPQMIDSSAKRVIKIHNRLLTGLGGFDSDVQTIMAQIQSDMSLLRLKSRRPIAPGPFSAYLGQLLWEWRLFVTPVIAGLDAGDEPFLCMQDSLGAPVNSEDFVVCGTSSDSLFGICEAMYKENLSTDELFEVVEKCIISALERDCLGGYGAFIHMITPDGILTREISCRND